MSNFTPKLIAIENNNDMSIDNNKIKKPAKSKEKRKREKSSVAKMLDISAYLMYIVGFIGGIACFAADYEGHLLYGIMCWLAGFIGASLIFGISEIIYYLIDIKLLLKNSIYE